MTTPSNPTNTVAITMIGIVPIPVGHQVEITWFQIVTVSAGLFGGDKQRVEELAHPRVVDRDTGIVYDHFTHYGDSVLRGGAINLAHRTLREGITPRQRLVGRVRACHVTTIAFERNSVEHVETLLELAVD